MFPSSTTPSPKTTLAARSRPWIIIQVLLLGSILIFLATFPYSSRIMTEHPSWRTIYNRDNSAIITEYGNMPMPMPASISISTVIPTYPNTFEGKGIQDWILDLLKPNPPKQLKDVCLLYNCTRLVTYPNSPDKPNGMMPVCVKEGVYANISSSTTASGHCIENPDPAKVYTQYVMRGILYDMSSSSPRLQRAPLLHQFTEPENELHPYRYPYNPSLIKFPDINYDVAGQGPVGTSYTSSLWLVEQMGTYQMLRKDNKWAGYHGPYEPKFIGLTLSVTASDYNPTSRVYDNFDLTFSNYESIEVKNTSCCTTTDVNNITALYMIDLRLTTRADGQLIAYGGHIGYGKIYNKTSTPSTSSKPIVVEDYHRWTYKDTISKVTPKRQKNWLAMQVQSQSDDDKDVLFLVAYFSPFTVVRCKEGQEECQLHIFNSLAGSSIPKESTDWRGSTPLIPIPGRPHVLFGGVHRRFETKNAEDWRNGVFRDRYDQIFVLVDSHSWLPIAYTDPFCIFGHTERDDIDWFEYIVGIEFTQTELVMTFGYNDYEPWIAILPISQVFSFFNSAYPNSSTITNTVNAIKHYYATSGSNVNIS